MSWDSANNVSLVPVINSGPIAIGATYGPSASITVPVNCEGYEVVIVPTDSIHFYGCDVTIDHYDENNNPIASEQFTVGNWAGKGGSCVGVRGKILGVTVQLTVQSAPLAWVSFITGGLASATTGVTAYFNALPSYAAPISRVLPTSLTGSPVGPLANTFSTAVTATGISVLNGGVALAPYCGNAFINITSETSGVNGKAIGFDFFTVGGGTSVQQTFDTAGVTGGANTPVNMNAILPAMACLIHWKAAGGSIAGNVGLFVTGAFD